MTVYDPLVEAIEAARQSCREVNIEIPSDLMPFGIEYGTGWRAVTVLSSVELPADLHDKLVKTASALGVTSATLTRATLLYFLTVTPKIPRIFIGGKQSRIYSFRMPLWLDDMTRMYAKRERVTKSEIIRKALVYVLHCDKAIEAIKRGIERAAGKKTV